MLGAIIGDITGSIYEFSNVKTKEFLIMPSYAYFTDDTILTIAVTKALFESKGNYDLIKINSIKEMKHFYSLYPDRGFGGKFSEWAKSDINKPYGSYGNGSSMRTSSIAYFSHSLNECLELAKIVASTTHNSIEGIKGAQAVSGCIYLLLNKKSKEEVKRFVNKNFYNLDFSIDSIRDKYQFSERTNDSVPQALECFFESKDFLDCLKLSISLGGDSDTICSIALSLAEAYYEIPEDLQNRVLQFIENEREIYDVFCDFQKHIGITKYAHDSL